MKKIKLFFTFLAFTSLSFTQNFNLVGERNINSNSNWDIPVAQEMYTDEEGNIYTYLTEASRPNSNELIRYNSNTNSWDNLTNNTFTIPNGSCGSTGVGQIDGSIFTVTISCSGGRFQYVHKLSPDGTFEDIGNPANTNSQGSHLAMAINPVNKELYYASAGLDRVRVQKYSQGQWIELPDVDNTSVSSVYGIDMDFDELGNPYVAYRSNNTNEGKVAVFDGNEWTNIFTSPGEGYHPNILVKSSTEVYLSLSIENINIQTYFYDGKTFEPIGTPVIVTENFGSSDILKASDGNLYLATYDDNGLYVFDRDIDNWKALDNNIEDNLSISGFVARLFEHDGFIYNTFTDSRSITTVRYELSGTLSTNNEDISANNFSIYPNPVDGLLTIQNINTSKNIKLTIYDLTGKVVLLNEHKTMSEEQELTINTSSLSPGAYLLKIKDEDNAQTQNFKVIINR